MFSYPESGSPLRDVREAKRVTQQEIAAQVTGRGVRCSQAHISRVESGQRRPSLGLALALAAVLEVPVGSLFPSPTEMEHAA